jgi:hypothetical protein
MGRRDAARIGQRQPRPLRMGDSDEGPRRDRPRRQFRPAFLHIDRHEVGRMRRREAFRQANRKDMPQLAIRHRAGMQFRAQDGGEAVGPECLGIDDGIAVAPDEMVGQRKEVIAFGPVAVADLLRLQHPVGPGGMGVQVAPPEAAGGGEGRQALGHLAVLELIRPLDGAGE